MKYSPSQVKNLMRRGLRLLLDPDPEPADRNSVYEFFDYCCAYCGTKLGLENRDLDHLIPAAMGGSNHISNRVLACKPCNAKEKREMAWRDFLKKKCPNEQVLVERQRRIEDWISQNGDMPTLPDEILRLLESECKRVTAEYNVACNKVRSIKSSLEGR